MSEAAAAGQRDRRGDWRPAKPISAAPLYGWPPRPRAALKWFLGFPGYLWPWNVSYVVVAVLTWVYLTPAMADMKTFAAGWIAVILGRNCALMLLVYGAWHVRLYVQKRQGLDYKYTSRWPATDNPTFLFRRQVLDNIFWTLGSALPIWTGYEVVTLWAQANGFLPYVAWADHPVWCALLMLVIPAWRDVHFYLVHRLIHWPPLYRSVYSLHHKNVDPGPWSGLAMHPVEHLLYFSGVLLHWVLPSNGLHVVFHLQHLAFVPAQGHAGFAKLRVADTAAIETGNYMHYLHHRYFEVNYGSDIVPIDQWCGTWHDGSEAAEGRMNARLRVRAERMAARKPRA